MTQNSKFPLIFAAAMTAASVAAVTAVLPAIVAMSRPTDDQVREQIARILKEESNAPQEASSENVALAQVSQNILKGDPNVHPIGNPSAQPVVEYFDYNCGFCKRFTLGVLEPLIEQGKVKVYLVHAPILGPGSRRMAQFATAAALQGRFQAAHAFLSRQKAATAEAADALMPALIKETGINAKDFETALRDGSADKMLKANEQLSAQAEVRGTPVIYVNGAVSRGALTMDQMVGALQNPGS